MTLQNRLYKRILNANIIRELNYNSGVVLKILHYCKCLQASIPSESLMIAFESEAVVLLTKEQGLCRQEKNGKVKLLPFNPQSNLLIIDLGGKN